MVFNWSNFLSGVSNDDSPSMRRRYQRREQDVCVLEINGHHYPIKDWSMGGALVEIDDKTFTPGQNVDFRIKFKLKDRVMDIEHTGTIVRKNKNAMAIQFDALPGDTRQSFDQVVSE